MDYTESIKDIYLQRTIIDKLLEGLFHPDSGNVSAILRKSSSFQKSSAQTGLRQIKNQAIRLIGILEYELIKSGIPEQLISIQSDSNLRRIERSASLQDVHNTVFSIYKHFQTLTQQTFFRPTVHLNEDIQSYIENNTTRKYTLNTMAAELGFNRSYMCEKFKKETGYTIHEYDTMCRIREAKLLLSKTEMPVSVIAARLCFSDQSHFQRVFKKEAGITPLQYREMLGKEKSTSKSN